MIAAGRHLLPFSKLLGRLGFFLPKKPCLLEHPVGFHPTTVVQKAQMNTVFRKINPVHHGYGTCASTFANDNNKNALRGSCSYFSSVLSEVISY